MHWAGAALVVLGLIAGLGGLFRAFWAASPGPEYRRLTAPARGHLENRVRDRHGDPAEDLPLLRTAAQIMIVQRNLLGLWLGCFLVQLGTTLWDLTTVHLVVTVLFAFPVLGLTLYIGLRARAGAEFLQRHDDKPEKDEDTAVPETGRTPEPADQADG